jgi:hypothetical protein
MCYDSNNLYLHHNILSHNYSYFIMVQHKRQCTKLLYQQIKSTLPLLCILVQQNLQLIDCLRVLKSMVADTILWNKQQNIQLIAFMGHASRGGPVKKHCDYQWTMNYVLKPTSEWHSLTWHYIGRLSKPCIGDIVCVVHPVALLQTY